MSRYWVTTDECDHSDEYFLYMPWYQKIILGTEHLAAAVILYPIVKISDFFGKIKAGKLEKKVDN